jgi:hypothetical protein
MREAVKAVSEIRAAFLLTTNYKLLPETQGITRFRNPAGG